MDLLKKRFRFYYLSREVDKNGFLVIHKENCPEFPTNTISMGEFRNHYNAIKLITVLNSNVRHFHICINDTDEQFESLLTILT